MSEEKDNEHFIRLTLGKSKHLVLSQLDEGTIVDIYPRGKDPNYKPRKWKRRNKE